MLVKRQNWKRLLLALYLFIVIFQPPLIPISTIYIFGLFIIMIMIINNGGKLNLGILTKSGMKSFYKIFLFLAFYVLAISYINLLLGKEVVIENTLRCINQLVVLTGIEFFCIAYFIKKCNNYQFSWNDIVWMIAVVGTMQGICSITAYISPQVRDFFLRYSSEVFKESYVLERRGYGFSGILLDTYGYGMGLIAGIVLLTDTLKLWQKFSVIMLCLISILLNARTGLVVFAIALMVFLFQAHTVSKLLVKSVLALSVLYIIWIYALPAFVTILIESDSVNLKWVGMGMNAVMNIFSGGSTLEEVTILSTFSRLPDNIFTLVFGTGHNVYGIRNIIGFHSDVGYINYLWEFGLLGIFVMVIAIGRLFIKAYQVSKGNDKFIVLFLLISYVVVLFKAVLIGYNPGVVVNYLVCFSLVFFGRKAKELTNASN